MQTAGRLAGEEDDEFGEGGAVIEALWVFEVPMALPIDARVSDEDLKRARKALARAKAVGEEYEGVEVATATVRARRAGEAIVHEAKRRGVEAIVLAAEEPTGIRGGLWLGGKQGLHDSFVGRDDPLRAPEGHLPGDPHGPAVGGREHRPDDAAGGAGGRAPRRAPDRRRGRHRGPLECPPDVRPRRRSRPRRLLRRHFGPEGRPHRLRARRGPALARAPRRRARHLAGRRPAAASRSAPRWSSTRSSSPASRTPTSSSPRPTATTPTWWWRSSPSGASRSPR